ncbi:MAG: flagellar biosynthetic protein FliO [Pseudomonadota bacterium]
MDGLDVARYFAALLLVLGLLAAFAFILRRFYGQGLLPAGLIGPDRRRMRVSETLVIDPRRRVVIVNIDGTEHVLLLGAGQELVLETRPEPVEEEPVFTSIPPDAPESAETPEPGTTAPRTAAQ